MQQPQPNGDSSPPCAHVNEQVCNLQFEKPRRIYYANRRVGKIDRFEHSGSLSLASPAFIYTNKQGGISVGWAKPRRRPRKQGFNHLLLIGYS